MRSRWVALTVIVVAQLCALSVWFSASAVLPSLQEEWGLSVDQGWVVTVSVQLGFACGATVSALLGLADRYNPKRIFMVASIASGVFNGLLIFSSTLELALVLRFLTGFVLAGVYPIAIKLVSLWFQSFRSISIGILIAGLTLGSALPYLLLGFQTDLLWQTTILISSVLAIIAGLALFVLLPTKETKASSSKFSFRNIHYVVRNRKVMYANYGYWFHMWELYAMWTWLPFFLMASFTNSDSSYSYFIAFVAIGIFGGMGSFLGGVWAERMGKVRFTIIAMTTSSICAILIGLTFQQHPLLTALVAIIWGASIIADSGQFSALVSDYASPEYVGTALTMQLGVGFLLTAVSIYLVSVFVPVIGWGAVFLIISIGPLLGVFAMLRLEKMTQST
ncbi:MFS transporter [Geomicrobium sp. JCM 19039]|uniref:MFS transporter n=1 Tax=Geomicrobium sp. JCM 19039 TaxID=1460636 RepID=UPI00045F18F4|nr:MFS transporter [Geomicrobium sp. JCM 19039]GAK10446.1 transport protein [Geomicrobium sp. JCM 19039]